MAGWQDGAEYAPIERPDAFAAPAVEALPVAAPYAADTPGAVRPPQVMRPPTSAIPLESLVPAEASVRRDPRAPFSVVSAIMTSDSAWGAAHRADQPGWAPEFDPTRPMGRVEATFPPPGPSVQAPAAGAPSWPARPADPWAPPGPPPHPGQFRQGPPFHQGPPNGSLPVQGQGSSPGLTKSQRQLLGAATVLLVLGCLLPALTWYALLFASGLTIAAFPRHPITRWLFVPPVALALTKGFAPDLYSSVAWALCLIYLIAIPLVFILSSDRNR